ncbi:hypothetical protein KAX35_04430 [candidate division WOR-3 bacterium]|nr:hypothetical protein [candidate division WOR-3 bacterium]
MTKIDLRHCETIRSEVVAISSLFVRHCETERSEVVAISSRVSVIASERSEGVAISYIT